MVPFWNATIRSNLGFIKGKQYQEEIQLKRIPDRRLVKHFKFCRWFSHLKMKIFSLHFFLKNFTICRFCIQEESKRQSQTTCITFRESFNPSGLTRAGVNWIKIRNSLRWMSPKLPDTLGELVLFFLVHLGGGGGGCSQAKVLLSLIFFIFSSNRKLMWNGISQSKCFVVKD